MLVRKSAVRQNWASLRYPSRLWSSTSHNKACRWGSNPLRSLPHFANLFAWESFCSRSFCNYYLSWFVWVGSILCNQIPHGRIYIFPDPTTVRVMILQFIFSVLFFILIKTEISTYQNIDIWFRFRVLEIQFNHYLKDRGLKLHMFV